MFGLRAAGGCCSLGSPQGGGWGQAGHPLSWRPGSEALDWGRKTESPEGGAFYANEPKPRGSV